MMEKKFACPVGFWIKVDEAETENIKTNSIWSLSCWIQLSITARGSICNLLCTPIAEYVYRVCVALYRKCRKVCICVNIFWMVGSLFCMIWFYTFPCYPNVPSAFKSTIPSSAFHSFPPIFNTTITIHPFLTVVLHSVIFSS